MIEIVEKVEPLPRKVQRFPLVLYRLHDLFVKGTQWKIPKGLPDGCKFETSYFDQERELVWITVSHESFPEVSDGEIIPELDDPITIQKIGATK